MVVTNDFHGPYTNDNGTKNNYINVDTCEKKVSSNHVVIDNTCGNNIRNEYVLKVTTLSAHPISCFK